MSTSAVVAALEDQAPESDTPIRSTALVLSSSASERDDPEESSLLVTPTKAEEKGSASSATRSILAVDSAAKGDASSSGDSAHLSPGPSAAGKKEEQPSPVMRAARPHHLPKLDSLNKRLDEIRKTMTEVSWPC